MLGWRVVPNVGLNVGLRGCVGSGVWAFIFRVHNSSSLSRHHRHRVTETELLCFLFLPVGDLDLSTNTTIEASHGQPPPLFLIWFLG